VVFSRHQEKGPRPLFPENVFACHQCKQQGDVIDLWAALHHQNLRQAALDLVRTFHLEPALRKGTEKRNG